jgi:hypothetical protein
MTRRGTPPTGTLPGGQPADLALHRAEIEQATGMLTEQPGTGIAEAFIRLRAHAYAHVYDLRLTDVARASSPAACGCAPTPTLPRMAGREVRVLRQSARRLDGFP